MFQFKTKIQFVIKTDLLGSKVYEEREKEDHETVEEKAEQGWVACFFFGTCLQIQGWIIGKMRLSTNTEGEMYHIFGVIQKL